MTSFMARAMWSISRLSTVTIWQIAAFGCDFLKTSNGPICLSSSSVLSRWKCLRSERVCHQGDLVRTADHFLSRYFNAFVEILGEIDKVDSQVEDQSCPNRCHLA